MPQLSAHADKKIPERGFIPVFKRRLTWYGTLALGRIVELMGNRTRVDGMVFSIDSPAIKTIEKWGLFFDQHEPDEQALLNQGPPTDLPLVEFGGGIGVISCLTNRKLVRPEQHVVVEANPGLVPLLERNRDLNGCRFQVINKALAYDAENVQFNLHYSLFGGGLNKPSDNVVSVPSTSLKSIADGAGFDQFSVICDIEGAEASLVEREIDTLRQHVRFLLVEVHPDIIGDEGASRILQTLLTSGFILRGHRGRNWAFTRD
jgi:FkbM family methyltransferase